MDRIMAVVTKEAKYSERFCDYVNRSDKLSILAVPFENMESCFEYSKKHGIELLISDASLSSTCKYGEEHCTAGDIDAVKRIFLADSVHEGSVVSDDGFAAFSGGSIVLNKYQSAESLMSQVIERAGCDNLVRTHVNTAGHAFVIGIYSPIMRCGKTSFALTMCRDLSRRSRVLYINLEEFPPVLKLLKAEKPEGGGLSEAVYKLKQGRLDESSIRALISSSSGIDWIAPVTDPEDNSSISGDDYAELIAEILKNTDYDYLILDMNRFSGQADALIELCGVVYMPCGEDAISLMKKESFIEYIQNERNEKWKSKLKWIKLPEPAAYSAGVSYLDSLLYGDMGDLVRDINRR